MIELLSEGVIALTTWAWLEVHGTSFAVMLATLLAVTVLTVVAAAILATVLRHRAAASVPQAMREPAYALAIALPAPTRPVGGRGPRAPGAAFGRLAIA